MSLIFFFFKASDRIIHDAVCLEARQSLKLIHQIGELGWRLISAKLTKLRFETARLSPLFSVPVFTPNLCNLWKFAKYFPREVFKWEDRSRGGKGQRD